MATYDFVTIWHIPAPIEAVWDAIYYSEHWPEWWRGLESGIELEQGDGEGIGNLRRYSWKGVLPYRLTFDIRTVRIENQTLIEGIASGDLEGTGIWKFTGNVDMTAVCYEWRVQTMKPWMNIMVPLTRPLFRWNHDRVMAWGKEGLTNRLKRKALLACR